MEPITNTIHLFRARGGGMGWMACCQGAFLLNDVEAPDHTSAIHSACDALANAGARGLARVHAEGRQAVTWVHMPGRLAWKEEQ